MIDLIDYSFAQKLIAWQRIYGRHQLPWQVEDAYCVWVSEIMLQQTQVSTVLKYYPRFIENFPTVSSLAAATEDEVLRLWQGLGYYSRAKNLHRAAQYVVTHLGGMMPNTRQQLELLPGIGRSTAAAIAAFSFKHREAILDGNVKRVLCRLFALEGNTANRLFTERLWQLAENLLPENPNDMPAYTQGLMDLGSMICKRSKPLCEQCPMTAGCAAKQQNRVHQLPQKKSSVVVKKQTLYWLILYGHQSTIWLRKRTDETIWSGLWCVPTLDSLDQLSTLFPDIDITDYMVKKQSIQHRLTHRLLEIIPVEIQLPDCSAMPLDSLGKWVKLTDLGNYGLPKPLSEYLQNQLVYQNRN